ncbi:MULTISPECIES: glycoside hydrolase family 36 protein [unclassified Rathayibacter]|uniref:glycoside hydrolase family 36 protein n=1 Tax=unclassified Rathayibacter TaxID=2609250 RepID=UPI0006FA5BEA|nr:MULTISPECIES: glycoside hydrolase family 36 protein [unclassified Rathayibacter]KQQ05829.1 alpha-galactosidase [Rathayibacter sp. Leaf294]KQS13686.1 alpha-galactosidase [Rathayibacter sp. Leaf185]
MAALPDSDDDTSADGPLTVSWRAGRLRLDFHHSPEQPVSLARLVAGELEIGFDHPLPLVGILAAGRGHVTATDRLVQTAIGDSLRYVSHEEEPGRTLRIVSTTGDGVCATTTIDALDGAFRATTTVENRGAGRLLLTAVTSWAMPLGTRLDAGAAADPAADWELLEGRSEWLGEGRWVARDLRGLLPDLHPGLADQPARESVVRATTGTWSTGGSLPIAALRSSRQDVTWLCEVAHNGPWRWEVGEQIGDAYLALSGPTDRDHQWSEMLAPGDTFTSVPALVAVGDELEAAAAALTGAKRLARRAHPDDSLPTLVFNDYMNTLVGDPTTEKLLPLVAAAAEVGAETFCIDAGWYAETASWWDTVGEWTPSSTRFPGGLGEVVDAIRSRGMVPGLWLEPEVIGVNSPMAATLPDEAFLSRGGVRVEESGRFHLDLRHPAALAHLDETVDRLVRDLGVGYFKLDYNIDPGPGTDREAASAGAGLLAHDRAHLDWIDGVLDRHPRLVLENCASGAMRADSALLSRMQLQSTSDQQDPLLYPPIAASAALSMLPEQAANWAYPQPEMSDEALAFTLVTGLAGRFYLSGHLDRMRPHQRTLVAEAVRTAAELRPLLIESTPLWPLGLPGWTDRWVASALRRGDRIALSLWDRGDDAGETSLAFPSLLGRAVDVEVAFPVGLPVWTTNWDIGIGVLSVRSAGGEPGARTLVLLVSE